MERGSIVKHRPADSVLTRPPTERNGLTARPRVARLIDAVTSSHRITVVEAPSGYAKTVAVAAWARAQQEVVAWATLTAYDAMPHLVDGIVIGALRQVGDSAPRESSLRALAGLGEPQGDHAAEWRALREVLYGLDEPVTLIVDDTQSCDEALADTLVAALVEQGPPHVRIVLVTQTPLLLHLAKLRAAGEVGLVRPSDLAFTPDEAVALTAALGRDIDDVRLSDLLSWTCGWPVALHLALLDVRRAEADHPSASRQEVQRVLSGLLIENVFFVLPDPLADFILATTTMADLDADVATDLTGRPDSAELLEECVHRGLFLDRYVGYDDRRSYRWHPVFRDLCQGVLRNRDPVRARELHRAAARVLAAHGRPIAAMDHAHHADDSDLAATIMRANWLWAVLETRGAEAARLLGEVTRKRPDDAGLRAGFGSRYVQPACVPGRLDGLGWGPVRRPVGDPARS